MSEVRPFSRADRDQLTRLANAHIATVMPGWSIPVSTLLAQLERQPGEYIIDPWVIERTTIVGIERDRVVAAAHLRRYGTDERVSKGFRNAGSIVWLICWPENLQAGREVRDAAIAQLSAWDVRVFYGDGALPTTATYGVSDSWPHISTLYEEAGFDASEGQVELQFAGKVKDIPSPGPAPLPGMMLHRAVGPLGTSFNAMLEGETVGVYEVDDSHSRGGSNLALMGWADECNHWVRDDLRGRGIGSWLLSSAGEWLRLGGTTRLLTYAIENADIEGCRNYYRRFGLQQVNRTVRGWMRPPKQ